MLTFITNCLNGSQSGPKVELSQDEIHHLLQNSRRREVVRALNEHARLSKRELIAHVCEEEYGRPVEEVHSAERQCVAVSLHQCHLPKLEDHEVVVKHHNEYEITEKGKELATFLI